jgi:TM2 domain-containing membrane protein YozV
MPAARQEEPDLQTHSRSSIIVRMKTRIVSVLLFAALLFAAAAAFAHPQMGWGPYPLPAKAAYLRAELENLYSGTGRLGDLTPGELREIVGQLSVAVQKDRFVARSEALSFMMPGAGQMLNGSYGSGAAFLTVDLAIVAGTIVGAYFLLPEDLQFPHLDYFNTPFSTIWNRWESHTFVEALPSLAVLVGGGLARTILGGISSHHAGVLARRNIDQGKMTFEPDLLLLPQGMLMGFGWRY